MRTYHVGGMNPIRRYKTLEAALNEAKDDDTVELHKNIVFSGDVNHNIIIQGNGHTISVENGSVGLNCQNTVVLRDIVFQTGPRANAVILQKGGRLLGVKAGIKGPARVLYPTIIAKAGKVILEHCDLMRVAMEAQASVHAKACVFRDYYGAVFHLEGKENLSVFAGKSEFTECRFDCCSFLGDTVMTACTIGAFNRSCCKLSIRNSHMAPTLNNPAVNLKKEPVDGPLERANETSRFSLEHENGDLCIRYGTSQIPKEFVGLHMLGGALEIRDMENKDDGGYHIIRRGSVSFVDTVDTAFYEIMQATFSSVRSTVRTSRKTKTAMERLQELVGLRSVKASIKSILNNVARSQKSGNKDFGFSYHMVFAGDPGTGKTTVAKIVAQALFEIGAVPENKCTEVSVDSLVKGYVGQTAEHVRNVLDKAVGGVLFIDEAYELTVKENQNSFNSEVLSVLIRYMEEHRDNLVVIAAGYGREMREFLASNAGLTRRFQWVQFEDYTPAEMAEIFESMRGAYQETYEKENLVGMLPKLFESLTMLYRRKPDIHGHATNGGNGGLVRNVFQQVLTARNNRVAEQPGGVDGITELDIKAGFRTEMEKAVNV